MVQGNLIRIYFRCCLGMAVLVPALAWCGIQTDRDDAGFDAAMLVEDHVLDTQCGGFVSPEGMLMNIKISRESFINNVLQPQNSFATGTIQLNGRNIAAGDLAAIDRAMTTVIQNNQDNRAISVITTLAIDIKNIGGLAESAKSVQDIRSSQDMQMFR